MSPGVLDNHQLSRIWSIPSSRSFQPTDQPPDGWGGMDFSWFVKDVPGVTPISPEETMRDAL